MKTEYIITNPNISKKIKICYISDIHSDIDKLKFIIEDAIKSKIDALLIGGDLINSIEDYTEKDNIKKILADASKKIDIFIGLGNHELVCHKEIPSNADTKYWRELDSIDGVNVSSYPNKNATFTRWSFNNIDITALNLPIEYYHNGELKEDLIKYLKILKDVNSEKFNILLLHSPINLIENKKIPLECLKEYDLILTGHMHSGLIPKKFRKKYGPGLVGPYKNFFPKYSYGLIKDGNTTIIISGGVNKITETSGVPFSRNKIFKKFINKIYPEEIEIINLQKKE